MTFIRYPSPSITQEEAMAVNRQHIAAWAAQLPHDVLARADAIRERLDASWAKMDQNTPITYGPSLYEHPGMTSLRNDNPRLWVSTRTILGDAEGHSWGKFSYRPNACFWLADRFLENVDTLASHPVKGVRLETRLGPLYWVTTDGLHRLATAKGMGLPYLPFECSEVSGIGGQMSTKLRWGPALPQPPLWERIWKPDLSVLDRRQVAGWEPAWLWWVLLDSGSLTGSLTRSISDGREKITLHFDSDSAQPWLLPELGFLGPALRHAYGLDLPTLASMNLPSIPSDPHEFLGRIPILTRDFLRPYIRQRCAARRWED